MKLLKYIIFIALLICSVLFIMKLDEQNIRQDNIKIEIQIPYITDTESGGLPVWQAIILTLSLGVFIGFIIALFQIISQKTEIISLKSSLRKSQSELENLRNKSLDDDIDLLDDDPIDVDDDI
ncbi:MAG: hypothetical protein CMG64_05815 [Candidatus Marinimicrobia bacterium]|nr:hypothetical protein [Candidatus Neomarinimicrobiota bacterium]